MALSVADATAFLVHEARILDEWRLDEWVALFDDDGEYWVPSLDAEDVSPSESLYLIFDDRLRLQARAERLKKRTAHAEYPHSRTTRLVSNVEVEKGEGDLVRVVCSFVVYRSFGDSQDVFPGRSYYDIRIGGSIPKIRRKTVKLGLGKLRPQGKLSIIV